MEKITIIIPTYNRACTLPRTLYSIEKQTVREFVCIVIDDGSTDGTGELVGRIKNELTFPVNYYYQENKGVLSARLSGIKMAETELIMLLDSDDEIVDNAIEVVLKTWDGLSVNDRQKYYGVGCLCMDYKTRNILGGMVPQDINNCSYKKYFKFRMRPEQFVILRRDILIQQYQEYIKIMSEANLNFVPESTLHIKYEMKYRFYYINKALRIYHREDTDSLSRSSLTVEKCRISYFSHTYILKHYFPDERLPFKMYFSSAMYAVKFAMLLGHTLPKVYKDVGSVSNKIVLTLALPFGIGNYLLGQKIKAKNK